MNKSKNQSSKQKPLIPQSKIGKPGSTPYYIQTEPNETEYLPLDTLQFRDTSPNCDIGEGKYKFKDQD